MTLTPFSNEEPLNTEVPKNRERIKDALSFVKSQFASLYPLYVGGKEIHSEKKITSYNPCRHHEVVGYCSQADQRVVDEAIAAAQEAYKSWRLTSFRERSLYLLKAAQVMRRRKREFIAWQIYEAGKNWAEADGEFNEAVDFLEMYARQAIKLEESRELVSLPGLDNRLEYLPLGIGVIISPWNFPLAILTGMTTSAIVTGNTVLVKPSSLTPVIASKFVEVMREVNVPDGVLNFVPGSSGEIGDYMVRHQDVNFISFTGSKDVGLHIDEIAHSRIPGQRWMKRVVAEMGGKNGVVVDETADLDAAADGIVTSAFGYQGQKCSAGSRAIVHEDVYETLIDKLIERTKALRMGPGSENNEMNAVIDGEAFNKINDYIEMGKREATLVHGGAADNSTGYYIEPTIFTDADPHSRIMQEEIFGPVLAVCKVSSFEEGIDIYNDTEYGLTGSCYTNKRDRIEYARQHMICGNLFFNGKCTGALVGVQPFGGYYMSGTGTKTGCFDYLLNFVQLKTTSEVL